MSETRLGAIESIQHKLSVLCIGASEDVRAELADLIEDVGNLERNTLSAGLSPSLEAERAKYARLGAYAMLDLLSGLYPGFDWQALDAVFRAMQDKYGSSLGQVEIASRIALAGEFRPQDGQSVTPEHQRVLNELKKAGYPPEWTTPQSVVEDGQAGVPTREDVDRGVSAYYSPDDASKRQFGVDPSWDFTAEKGSVQDRVRIAAVLRATARQKVPSESDGTREPGR